MHRSRKTIHNHLLFRKKSRNSFLFYLFFVVSTIFRKFKALLGNHRHELFYFYLLLICILKRILEPQKCPWVTDSSKVFRDLVKEIRRQLKIFDQRS